MHMLKRATRTLPITVAVLAVLAGCGGRASSPAATPHVTVGDINANPEFVGHEVSVCGRVSHDLGVGPAGTFELVDGTGEIHVISAHTLPLEGAQIEVDGTPRQLFVVGRRRKIILMAKAWQPCLPTARTFEGPTKRP
jgi:hypothetical protein